jgi:Mor family transcriptional regulator
MTSKLPIELEHIIYHTWLTTGCTASSLAKKYNICQAAICRMITTKLNERKTRK